MSLSWNAPNGDVIPAGSYIDYTYVNGVQGHKIASIANSGTLGGGGSYSHDTNGNVTHDGLAGLDLQYNLLNLTKRISSGGTTLADYHYLADGTRGRSGERRREEDLFRRRKY